MDISLNSKLTLFPLSIKQDKKHYIVEECITGEFYEMPKVCIDAIEMINNGNKLEQIQARLQQAYPDEEVDIIDFAKQLFTLGLINEIDGVSIEKKKEKKSKQGFLWIPQKLGKIFFNQITTKLFFLIFTVNILFIATNVAFIPSYKDIFIFDAMLWNILTYAGISLLLVFIHEMGHVLAIRAQDLSAKWGIGHRLLLVVVETDMTTAWRLSPKQRNVLYLGGICFDQVMIFIALAIKLTISSESMILSGILSIIVFDIFIKTIYQCCFYMKTDLYFVFENITGCYNLMENSKQYLRKWFPFIKKDNTTTVFSEERRVIRVYSNFYLIGIILTLSLFGLYFIPQLIFVYSQILPKLLEPINTSYFWDAVVVLGQSLLMIGLLLYSVIRSKLSKR